MTPEERICDHLVFLYGKQKSIYIWSELKSIMDTFSDRISQLPNLQREEFSGLTERDAVLITYGDQFQEPGLTPLQSLNQFLKSNFSDELNSIHILPFYPYSSDDGFSVIDFRQVDPRLGNWEDIFLLSQNFQLMFDAVVNHISRHSEWFEGFQRGDERYKDYFITVDPQTDLSMIVRPRALPLLTPVDTSEGTKHVWTTFSDDQIDLNFQNPQVLLEIIDLLLFYVERGARIIRLDAIAYLWKEIGTSSIHLPQTHRIVKIFRAVLDILAPWVYLITETNVPHEENISYFGDPLLDPNNDSNEVQGDEAHMVYQFPLAPLVLHTFISGDAGLLTKWASDLQLPFTNAIFFNFIASHDGIGVRPAEGLLSENELQALVERTNANGGNISSRTHPDGSTSVYELNITLYDALNDPQDPKPEIDTKRFIASQVILLSLAGLPGIYIHSLFGSRNCHRCVEETGRSRSINRQKFQRLEIQDLIANPLAHQSRVFSKYKQLLSIRRRHPAFNPNSPQKVLSLHNRLFAILRTTADNSDKVLCLINISHDPLTLDLSLAELEFSGYSSFIDLISNRIFVPSNNILRIEIESYQSLWISTSND